MAEVESVPVESVSEADFLLDVREDDEWASGHIAWAVHIPMSALMGRVAEVPADRDVIVVCGIGARSARVVEYFAEQGRQMRNLHGGLEAWVGAGRPLVTSE